MRLGIVAGEASGDLLGAGLIQSLRARRPDLEVVGIGGERMIAAGCDSLYPMERLSVMGLLEVLGRVPELFRQRRRLARYFIANPPDVFVGIDAPDYNLGLEMRLKRAGIPTVHYVSPSVWAWRTYRVRRMARSTSRVLTLLPFEAEFYERHGIPVSFVGHPGADSMPLQPDRAAARRALGLTETGEYVALLPGSRGSEVRYLAEPLLAAARWLRTRRSGLQYLVPLVSERTRALFDEALAAGGTGLSVHRFEGRSREVLTAADVALLASGTATLEAMLAKCPMVVTYRLHPLTYRIARRLVRLDHYALPNLLAGRALVPELIQDAATPERLGAAVLGLLEDPSRSALLRTEFEGLHRVLRRDASEAAARAVLETAGA